MTDGPKSKRTWVEIEEPLPAERLLSRDEVEQIFGFPTKRWLELAALRGDGPPYVKIGRTVRYRVEDIRVWIDLHVVTNTSRAPRVKR